MLHSRSEESSPQGVPVVNRLSTLEVRTAENHVERPGVEVKARAPVKISAIYSRICFIDVLRGFRDN